MTTAGVWGATTHAEGLAQDAEQTIERVQNHLPHQIVNHIPFKDQSSSSDSTDTSSDLDKIGSTHEVAKLARSITQQSFKDGDGLRKVDTAHSAKNDGGEYKNAFIDTSDPTLNPDSEYFRPEVWVRTLIGLQSRDPERYPKRVAGIGYRNLNVHGFGSLTDYQK